MSDSLAAVQARVAELQALLGVRTSTGATASSTGSAGFATALAGQLELLGGGVPDPATTAVPGTGATGGSAGAGELGDQAVQRARAMIGTPYRWGGTDPGSGLDCSGLVQTVYAGLGVRLPRVSADQARAGAPVASLDQARPGDLVCFGSPVHHIGIYVGDGKMIDAPHRGATVGVHSVWGTPTAIRRVTPTGVTGSAAAGAATAVGGSLGGPYAALFEQAGRRYGVDPALLSAVARAESSYRPGAVSAAGARGLMQLMPGTARGLGVDPDDPTQAVDGAARLLSGLLARFGGRVDHALAGYNAGPGAVTRYGGIPPYAETRGYVDRVLSYWEDLK